MQAKKLQTWAKFPRTFVHRKRIQQNRQRNIFARVKSWLVATILPQTSFAAPIFPVSVGWCRGRHCVYICSI